MDEFKQIIGQSRAIFLSKMKNYGTAWRILRLSSLTDQLLIKIYRIRNLEQLGTQKVADTPITDLIGIVNYATMALIQLKIGVADDHIEAHHLDEAQLLEAYDQEVDKIYELLLAKNHDYGNIWKQMRLSSHIDQILMKILRLKQIEDTESQSNLDEPVETIYQDIVNYAVFALIMHHQMTHS